MPENTSPLSESGSGFILVAVLWVTMILSIFALNFSTRSRLQGTQVLNMEKMYQEELLLQSGLEYGYHEFLKYEDNKGLVEQQDEIEAITEEHYDLWYPRYEPYNVTFGDTEVAIRLVNMAGTLNINKVKLSLLQEVLIRCGLDNGTEVTSVANSILDWIDEDGLRRAESAEKDYYLSRGTSPYWPKNNEIESIEELLLVKEVTPEIFYGNEQRPGLKDFFSAYGQGEKMDINSATPQTFSLIRGLPQDVIDNICSLRQDQPLKDLSELASLVPQRYFSQIHKYYYVSNLKVLKVEASLVFESGKYGRSFQRMYNIGS